MKTLVKIGMLLLVALYACTSENEDLTDGKQETIRLETDTILPELSIYNLPSKWTNQDGEEIELKDMRGDVVVMVMIYTTCRAACPRLVADMRNIHKSVPAKNNKKVKYVLVSIDPEVDTPELLKEFSIENQMDDTDQWVFLRGTESDTREFAAVLAVSYKAISPIDFSHSNIISVFDQEGVLVHQKEGLGVDSKETVDAIIKLSAN